MSVASRFLIALLLSVSSLVLSRPSVISTRWRFSRFDLSKNLTARFKASTNRERLPKLRFFVSAIKSCVLSFVHSARIFALSLYSKIATVSSSANPLIRALAASRVVLKSFACRSSPPVSKTIRTVAGIRRTLDA